MTTPEQIAARRHIATLADHVATANEETETDLLLAFPSGDPSADDFKKFIAALRINKPHRFKNLAMQELEKQAAAGNWTARSKLFKQLGRAAYAAAEASWKDRKPGSAPRGGDPQKNPWVDDRNAGGINVDPKTGRYTASALTRMCELARKLPLDAVAGIARSAGSYLGATKPPKVAA